MSKGFLLTFEGPEGGGKTEQSRRLFEYCQSRGIPVVITREPGGDPLASQIREVILSKKNFGMDSLVELFLFLAARRNHALSVLQPSLRQGRLIVCDRFTDSTRAYQGFGHGIDLGTIDHLNSLATGGLVPDLTLLLDISVEQGLARRQGSVVGTNRLDEMDTEFHERVRKGYLLLARNDTRFVVVDAQNSIEEVWESVKEIADKKILPRFQK